MTDEFDKDAGRPPADNPIEEMAIQRLHQLHGQEIAQLSLVISQLLQQVESLQLQKSSEKLLSSHILQLREANQNLVLATFGAQDMQAAAEATSMRQTEFLSMLAHELRNPLQPIAMANQLLGKLVGSDPQLPRLQEIIGRQVGHLVRLVDDLLDASRVSSGKISLQKRQLTLKEVIDNAVETSQPFIERRHQQLVVELPAETIFIHGDLVRLAQVFSNLLINASKFSADGERIAISGRKDLNTVRIVVEDNGIGVTPDIQPFIFDLFTQGLRSMERSQGGLGIGLSLVRTLLEMHGGSVRVISAGAGLGSQFVVQLPLGISQSADPLPDQVLPTARPQRRRILLIEDNVDANETLRLILEQEGHVVTPRFDGFSAVVTARIHPYEIIICDIGLAGMDGFEVARQIRAATLASNPILIATSGYNQEQDRQRALECGFDHYLVKPIAIGILLSLIEMNIH